MAQTEQHARFQPSETVDFVIVGSGAAGGIIAKELSTAGFSVVVLEQGPRLTESQFDHDEFGTFTQSHNCNDPVMQPQTFRATPHDRAKKELALIYGRLVGGSNAHFTANFWRLRPTEFRQQFPGIEITARGSQDSILTRLECGEQPSPQNRFSGNNRGHWCNQDYEKLVSGYRGSLREAGQGQAIKSIQDLVLDELPIMLLNYQVAVVFARKGVTAFQDDFAGGSEAGRIYGTYGRNAHEWDVS